MDSPVPDDRAFVIVEILPPSRASVDERVAFDVSRRAYRYGDDDPEDDDPDDDDASASAPHGDGHWSDESGTELSLPSPPPTFVEVVNQDYVQIAPGVEDWVPEDDLKRSRSDVPRGSAKAISMQLKGVGPSDNEDSKNSLLYTVRIEARNSKFSNDPKDDDVVPGDANIDTGTEFSWFTGEPNFDLAEKFEINVNPPKRLRPGILRDYGFDPTKKDALAKIALKRVRYADTQRVLVAKLPDGTKFDISFPCYVYNTSTERLEEFRLPTSGNFGVGIAVSSRIANEKADGTLGLGLEDPRCALFDKNGVPEPAPTCAMEAISQYVRKDPYNVVRRGPCPVYHCYVNLHNPSLADRVVAAEDMSFIAFNNWPCLHSPEDVMFSPVIPVVRFSNDLSPWSRRVWAINLLSFEIQRLEDETWVSLGTVSLKGSNGEVKPLPVLLDTGSACSWLPRDMIEQLNDIIACGESDNVTHVDPTFNDPASDRCQLTTQTTSEPGTTASRRMLSTPFNPEVHRIVYQFEGAKNATTGKGTATSAVVTVIAQSWPFLCHGDQSSPTALIRVDTPITKTIVKRGPTSGALHSEKVELDRGTFGLNWFETMIVGMYSSLTGAYVRLAPQTPDNHRLPTLPDPPP